MEQRHFCQASLEYVFLLQEVQERKKFEFVETVSCLLEMYDCSAFLFFLNNIHLFSKTKKKKKLIQFECTPKNLNNLL